MLLFRTCLVCLFILMPLSGCGFSPLYMTSNNKQISDELKNIKISNITNQEGQFLRNLLLDSFYSSGIPNRNPPYRLDISSPRETITNLGIKKDATATRSQMRTQLYMTLVDITGEEPKIILNRSLRSINSFNVLDNLYATRVSQQSVREQSLKDLSEQILREVSLYFNNTNRQKTDIK